MVGVHMCQKYIRLLRSDTEILQPCFKCGPAFWAVEAGVDQQTFLSRPAFDEITVEKLQRVFRQNDLNTKDIVLYMCNHLTHLSLYKCR